ncbi:Eco57I restriction-modification methylase domain-containing protein [Natrinema salaciae]|uniref:site-specific DNA-methyltransferase (adenine-specific) n=1 Tax=Natrinema salaciae TaxID=1186196 RepID=A0A1H9RRQ2_9EURY|nr:TaqI-like C-terminal specificity domain-containing protein [Natrinema salaciae]SER74599.1 Methyltransferase domain-containing protein [Natrinema salaciae]
MQRDPTYRTNCGLFSTRYLEAELPETDAWNAVDRDELRAAYDEIDDRWERLREGPATETAARLEAAFVRPVFRTLGIPFEADGRTDRPRQRPDYAFFDATATARDAVDRRDGGGDFYADAVAVADVRRWDRPLDTRGSGEFERDWERPGHRMRVSLRETPTRWGVLTNGRMWRLYRASTGHRPDSYYEIDLPTALQTGDLEAFKYFYCVFRHEAFVEDADGDCFLDDVYSESEAAVRTRSSDLAENAREALETLVAGFRNHPDNDIDERDLESVRDAALVYLFRLLVVCYADSGGRGPLEAAAGSGGRASGLRSIERAVAAEFDETGRAAQDRRPTLQSRLDDVFERFDERTALTEGSKARAADSAERCWLFRTDPGESGRRETRFLATHAVGDTCLRRVIELLTRRPGPSGDGQTAIDYGSLDADRLGCLYEGLLEYEPGVATEPLALEDGEYVSAADADAVAVEPGEVYLATDSGERKATGSYYTPEYLVEYIVERTLEPLVAAVREQVLARHAPDSPGFADAFADRIFDLNVLDPAMGCGRFLARTVDYLAREVADAYATQAAAAGVETVPDGRDSRWARRRVARQCVYGVDCDPLAVELARLSLWLRTGVDDAPLGRPGRHLRAGNALVGGSLAEIEDLTAAVDGWAEDVQQPRFRRRLEAVANVRTAREFGSVDVPADAVDRLTAATGDGTCAGDDETWARLARAEWFETAQARADAEGYVHWPLAFPDVFYEDDGTERERPGFDAVVGNPPWVATAGRSDISAAIEPALWSYLEDAFEATENQFDLAVALYERAVRLSRDGRVGLVVPDSILTREGNEPIRTFLLEKTSLSRIVRVGTAFEGVETGAVVCISGDGEDGVRCADAAERTTLTSLSYDAIPQRVFERQDANRFLIHLDDEARSILETIDRHTPLEEYATLSRGEECGKRADHLASSRQADGRPIVPGGAVQRYGFDDDAIRYVEPDDIAKDEAYYRSPKLVFRQTSESLVGTYDAAGRVTIKSAYGIHAASDSSDELKHLLGALNSPLLNFYHHYRHAAYRSVFPQINQSTFEAVPIAMDDGPDSRLVEAVDERLAATAERSRLSPDVHDHLGRYEDGESLGAVADCRPVDGVEATKLAATTETWPNLLLGTVDIAAGERPLVLRATVRYKPDADAPETDQWGYAETEPIPALEWHDIDAGHAALVEAFVPAAVDAGRGFAGFRKRATKTTSPLDRLRSVTLPRLADVTDGLDAYLDDRARTAELDERIAALDRRIADRVFDLYGLPSDERTRVRSEFGGDSGG